MKNQFKKISTSEKIYVENNFATNRVWIFNTAWLNENKSSNNLQVRNRIAKEKLSKVTAKMQLQGNDKLFEIGIMGVVDTIDLSEFRAVSPRESKPVQGFVKGDATQKDIVAFKIGGKPSIDVEFFAALEWDTNVTVMVRGEKDPVVLAKDGQIVGMIAPLNINN